MAAEAASRRHVLTDKLPRHLAAKPAGAAVRCRILPTQRAVATPTVIHRHHGRRPPPASSGGARVRARRSARRPRGPSPVTRCPRSGAGAGLERNPHAQHSWPRAQRPAQREDARLQRRGPRQSPAPALHAEPASPKTSFCYQCTMRVMLSLASLQKYTNSRFLPLPTLLLLRSGIRPPRPHTAPHMRDVVAYFSDIIKERQMADGVEAYVCVPGGASLYEADEVTFWRGGDAGRVAAAAGGGQVVPDL